MSFTDPLYVALFISTTITIMSEILPFTTGPIHGILQGIVMAFTKPNEVKVAYFGSAPAPPAVVITPVVPPE